MEMKNNDQIVDKNTRVSIDERFRIEEFIYREAELADAARYDEWLELWATGDIEYWVPCNDDNADPLTDIGIILDDRQHLLERISRMKHRFAHTFIPSARIQRVVSNLQYQGGNFNVEVRSTFVLGSLHKHVQETWFGRSHHFLVMEQGDWKMRSKKVLLLNNDESLPNLLFLP